MSVFRFQLRAQQKTLGTEATESKAMATFRGSDFNEFQLFGWLVSALVLVR
jgi:hypothetical protein